MHRWSNTPRVAKRHSAQALVEFALIVPVMLILVLGSIDVGRALVYGVSVQDGARQAARLGTTSAIDPLITDTMVFQRLIDASKPALGDCLPVATAQACGGGNWTFDISIVTLSDGTFASIAAAKSDRQFPGSQMTVTATGAVSMLAGISTVVPGSANNGPAVLTLFPITARGQTVMMVF